MRRRRSGFTFVEVLTAMTIIAILAGIVLPKIGDFIERAQAAVVIGDFTVVRDAVEQFYTDSAYYPLTAAMGQMPPSLNRGYLPSGFSFARTGYTLQYNNWTLRTRLPGHPSTTTLIGVSVKTIDPRLGQLVEAQWQFMPHYQSGSKYTFIIIGL